MTVAVRALMGASLLLAATGAASAQTTITVATVNNGDMIRMQRLMPDFNAKHPDIKVNWVTLEENVLRQRVTTDIASKGGQYDVLTIGNYEVPIWAKQNWLLPLENLGADYQEADLLPQVAQSLTVNGKLYAVPFYAESSMLMYRADLLEKAGLKMPENPDWDFITEAAAKMTDKAAGMYGICLRGKAGWGENMAFLTSMNNSMGGAWFDMKWKPQFDGPEWKKTLETYLKLMSSYGPPGASSNGFNENLALFQTGKCGMWIDATVAASFLSDPKESKVADKLGFAPAPTRAGGRNHGNWLWSWNLAIPASSAKADAAKTFVAWATSPAYAKLVAEKEGIANVPPGTRTSLYKNPDYLKAAPFAPMTLKAIQSANTQHPSEKEVPYTGGQFVAIPEFQAIGTAVGQQFSAALAGKAKADQALAASQALTSREMTRAGYPK
ncbi:sorbitol/mannitol transport system substrate-binding protein [Ancylobacter sp. 3268]|uniref:ABC transporter substrate-binding protein n=1 Tax=Ancylobacter sp. 3268 TaxID=2817752 RepID=UPI0028642119|nr:sugar ABC transporter substrate-binding protein [Ancylobacter sp. 3268]MDR6951577.1 sorbitol/mannitol transport system substrate-binding protein [Ancylobacter sp. 3268]